MTVEAIASGEDSMFPGGATGDVAGAPLSDTMRARPWRAFLVASLLAAAYLTLQTARVSAAGLTRGAVTSSTGTAVTLRLSVGYGNIYRGSAWTPVRVAVRNGGSADLSGTLEIPQAASSATGAQPDYHGQYEAPVVVPAGGTKDVTLYVPGSGVQGTVTVRLLAGRAVLATASATPIGLDASSLLIGVLASDPASMGWIAPAIQPHVTAHVIQISPATLDSIYQPLSTFDIIVLTNVDTSQLDHAQQLALREYVRNGGSILLVGGPAWQETLRPLQGALLPGALAGTRVLPNLRGLLSLVPDRLSPGSQTSAAVSVLSRPSGTVLADQSGVPLVVRANEGQGTVEYLAFDPALRPVNGWAAKAGFTEHLLAMAAPAAISRTWSPSGFRARFQRLFQSVAITDELTNLPAATLPFLVLFAVLTLGYLLILGPLNFLLLRRIRRQSLAWITIPLLGALYLASIFAITPRVRASSTVLNSVGLVSLGNGGPQPATFYMGLATPMSGDYHLTYGSTALAAPLPTINRTGGFSFRDASMLHATPLRMRLQEDPQTMVTFLAMQRWSVRDMSLDTSVSVPGGVQSGLTLDGQGNLAGTLRNGTNLDLLDPVLMVGQNLTRLPSIPAGKSIYARLPASSGGGYSQSQAASLIQAYGGSAASSSDDFGFGFFRDFGGGASYSPEAKMIDRVRNALSMLTQAQPNALPRLGNAMLIGWTEEPLGTISVDGSSPSRRDLTLVGVPLSIHFPPHGPFLLRSDTFGSRLVDILPRAPQSSCCSFGFGDSQQGEVSVGSGGFLTFEFDLGASRYVHFRQLTVRVGNPGDSITAGSVYDWGTRAWVKIGLSTDIAGLSQPSRFISSQGRMLVRVNASGGDLTIADPVHDIQVSGSGTVS